MLKLETVTYVYEGTDEGIRDVTVEISREHIFAVLGRSGAGKTTLLRCLGRFLKPQKGRITLDDRDIQSLGEVEFRKALGIVFQRLFLFPHMTVLENVMLAPVHVMKRVKADAERESLEMLDRLGIGDLRDKYPSEISGGQAQRVAICRGLMLKPEYLLLDEPTAALDLQTTNEFARWLDDLKADTTFVIVTHDTPFVEQIASKGVLMEGGRVVAAGGVDLLVTRIQEQIIASAGGEAAGGDASARR